MTRPFRLAVAVLVIVGTWLLWPTPAPEPSAVEMNGWRVAKRQANERRVAAEREREWEAKQRATDAARADTRRRIRTAVPTFDTLPARVDSAPRVIVGDVLPGDTLIALRVVRRDIGVFLDSTLSAVSSLEAAVMLERGRASLTIRALQTVIASQDTVNAGLKAELRRKTIPVYRRALRGVENAVAGLACGGAGYVLGGPIAGVGAGVVCAAVSGIRR